jgi:hypothetical protein
MRTLVLTSILIFLAGSLTIAQAIPPDSLYLGQTPPGNTPVVFNLAVDPDFFDAERIAISNDGSEIYYSEVMGYYPINTPRIKKYTYSGSQWTGPTLLFDGYLATGLSVTGDTMFFQNANSVYETFISVRNGQNWSTPRRILENLNSAHYLQVTNSGNYYISSIPASGIGGNDWCRLLINGGDSSVSSLGLPLNTSAANLDFFISRDESFMIITRPAPVGLSVSYHRSDGGWTNPKSLGSAINFGLGMWGPYVTSDKKYLFYTTGTMPDYSDTHVHWVRVDSLIDSLKYTNYAPYVKNKIADQSATKGLLFDFTIPDSTFVDDDGNNTLTYSAKLTNGNALPGWLSFDSITGTFNGTPDVAGVLNIRLTATDTAGASVFTTFKITVNEPAGTGHDKEQGIRVFPNPSTGQVRISVDAATTNEVTAEITTLTGKVIQTNRFRNDLTVDLAGNPKGIYLLKLCFGDEIIMRKICLN